MVQYVGLVRKLSGYRATVQQQQALYQQQIAAAAQQQQQPAVVVNLLEDMEEH